MASRHLILCLALLAACLPSQRSHAQQDPAGYKAAAALLWQSARPQTDGRHHQLLQGLRSLEDASLRPLFNALTSARDPQVRISAYLGLAELHEERRLDLAAIAEIENPHLTLQLLTYAMDNGLLDAESLKTLERWQDLGLPARQMIAVGLIESGEAVDTGPFRAAVTNPPGRDIAHAELVQYAVCGLILAEQGERAGFDALKQLDDPGIPAAQPALMQALKIAADGGFGSVAQLALSIAQQESIEPEQRLLAIYAALRLGAEGAGEVWLQQFKRERDPSQRFYYAFTALDSAKYIEPGHFKTLIDDTDPTIRQVGIAAKAIASDSGDLTKAMAGLIALGSPQINGFLLAEVERYGPDHGPAIYEQFIRAYNKGEDRHRDTLIADAITATARLCEDHPDAALQRLPALLAEPADSDTADLQRRQIVLMGMARTKGTGSDALRQLVEAVGDDDHGDLTTDALRLLLRARHGLALTDAEWARASDYVQGVGRMDLGLRVQLAWLYLEHLGRADEAVAQALR